MQVNTQNIKRPALYSDFMNLELLWNNEFLTYIQTTVNAVTSTLSKIAKTTANNIKKQLNDNDVEYYRASENPLFLNRCHMQLNNYEDELLFIHSKSSVILFVRQIYSYYVDYLKLYKEFSIFNHAVT